MQDLYYHAVDIAVILSSLNLHSSEEAILLNKIWAGEIYFILPEYRVNQKKFFLDVKYWMHCFHNKTNFNLEYPAIQKDFITFGHTFDEAKFVGEYYNLDLFFKSMRIKILYCSTNHYARIKLRTLLRAYGYKRRSANLITFINRCILFYHLQPLLRGGVKCDIEEIPLDNMITFKVLK